MHRPQVLQLQAEPIHLNLVLQLGDLQHQPYLDMCVVNNQLSSVEDKLPQNMNIRHTNKTLTKPIFLRFIQVDLFLHWFISIVITLKLKNKFSFKFLN